MTQIDYYQNVRTKLKVTQNGGTKMIFYFLFFKS